MVQSRLQHSSIQQWQTHSGEVIIKWKEPKGFGLDVNCDNLKCNSMWLSDHNHSSYSSRGPALLANVSSCRGWKCFQLPRLKHQKRSRSWYDPQPGISVEQVIRGAGCYLYQNQKLCTFQRRTIIVRLRTSHHDRSFRAIPACKTDQQRTANLCLTYFSAPLCVRSSFANVVGWGLQVKLTLFSGCLQLNHLGL